MIAEHRLPPALFDAMAEGGGGAEAMRELAAMQRSKHLLMLRGVLTEARSSHRDQSGVVDCGYDLLASAQDHDPAAADVVIRHPSVGAWARHALRAFRGQARLGGAEPSLMCVIAAAAAVRAGLSAQIEVPVRHGAVMLPSLGAAQADGDRAVVRSTAAGATVDSEARRVEIPADPHRDAPGWAGLRRIRIGSFEALIDDLDPFRMPRAPDLAARLGDAEASTWAAAFRQAWPLLERHHPGAAAEVAATVKVIVPRQAPPRGLVSSSSPEAFGAVAMSPPRDGRILAETLVHEVQHVKLSALVDVVPLTQPDDGSRFYAPWRDDPRPAGGLLQGAYAYLGVSGFWRRQRLQEDGPARIRADADYERWRSATALATATLRSSGSLNADGRAFVRGMTRTLETWLEEPVPEQARVLARREAEQHRRNWEAAHGPIPS